MGRKTEIGWCDHTFNGWWGCQKISPGCDHCYAAALDHRIGGDHWGPKATYRTFSEKHWNEPRRWDAAAAKAGRRARVFCSSMADVFDLHAPLEERAKLWVLIRQTPHLDWLLLTKRPQNFARFLPWTQPVGDAEGIEGTSPSGPWANVWLGVTVEDEPRAIERIPVILRTPAAVRFVSYEPALELVDFDRNVGGTRWIGGQRGCSGTHRGKGTLDCPRDSHHHHDDRCERGLDWIIYGDESGPGARPGSKDWARAVRDQCARAGVAFFLKQFVSSGVKDKEPVLDGRQHVEFPR